MHISTVINVLFEPTEAPATIKVEYTVSKKGVTPTNMPVDRIHNSVYGKRSQHKVVH